MEYSDSERARELAADVRRFVDEIVIPVEREWLGEGPVDRNVVDDLRDEARDRGIYAPQISKAYGGLGLEFRDVLPAFEEAGRSLLAPAAIRVDAPDEGNMHALEFAGTDEQRERWLKPLVDGETASGFSMTEPMNGGGSDPKMIRTTARRDGDEWVVDGREVEHLTTFGG